VPIFGSCVSLIPAVGKGDSGGPVHVPKGSDPSKTYAQGIMSAANYPAPCPPGVPTSQCFSYVYYTDIARPLQVFWAEILTAG
jgi:hypothetical protein